ncbi:hypothetical protein BJX63DRAFT_136453 [Aspergillus granulosus]|uniref:Uncharacterized protein n=1 Tax=Aspergillus granulosus TaxID=176169 RepID=A0ABR4GSJ1_9EURO
MPAVDPKDYEADSYVEYTEECQAAFYSAKAKQLRTPQPPQQQQQQQEKKQYHCRLHHQNGRDEKHEQQRRATSPNLLGDEEGMGNNSPMLSVFQAESVLTFLEEPFHPPRTPKRTQSWSLEDWKHEFYGRLMNLKKGSESGFSEVGN